MKKQLNTYVFGIVVLSTVFFSLQNAYAWVAARGGYHGRGFVAAGGGYHGGYYHHDGCYGCGAAGLAVGAMAGAAIANASKPTVVVQQPAVVVQQPATVVQQPAVVTHGNYPIGTQLANLPAGSKSMEVNGVHYYQSGPTWFKPYFGSSGVYYEAVAAP